MTLPAAMVAKDPRCLFPVEESEFDSEKGSA